MSERKNLKIVIVFLLTGCFLVSLIACAYASSDPSTDSSSEDTGSEDTGSDDTSSEDTSSDDTGSDDTGSGDTGSDDTGSDDTGSDDTGSDDTGSDDTGSEDTGSDNTGSDDTGSEDTGSEDTGSEDTDSEDTGSEDTSSDDTGSEDTGSEDTSSDDTGSDDTGSEDLEDKESKSSEHIDSTESHYSKTETYNVDHSEYTKIENNQYIQTEISNKEKDSNYTGLSAQAESKQEPPSASVSLHGEKTEVFSGEDILLKLSAVNLITKPVMHVQVIVIPPSGTAVSSSEFVQSGAGQYTTTYELEPGQGRDIEVRIESNQVGNFNVKGRVVYYFGEDIENAEDYALDLPITVKAESNFPEMPIPGFSVVNVFLVLMGAFTLKRKNS